MKKSFTSISKFFCLLLLTPSSLWAAACCGGGSSSATLITGDYQSQLSLATSYSNVEGMQTNGQAIFWEDGHHQRTLTYKLTGATMIGERAQIGASTEYLKKDYSFSSGASESSSTLGDVTLQLGYELLTESYYTSLLPRILIGLAHSLPTGTGLEESTKPGLSDVSGLGRHQTSLTVIMLKRRPGAMFSLKLEAHERWERTQSNKTKVGSSSGLGFELSATRIPPKLIWSYGASFSTRFNEGHQVTRASGTSYRSAYERVSEVALFSALALPKDWEVALRYVDQTLIGPAKNSSLSRTATLALTKYIPL